MRSVPQQHRCQHRRHVRLSGLIVSRGAAAISFSEMSLTDYESRMAELLAMTIDDDRRLLGHIEVTYICVAPVPSVAAHGRSAGHFTPFQARLDAGAPLDRRVPRFQVARAALKSPEHARQPARQTSIETGGEPRPKRRSVAEL